MLFYKGFLLNQYAILQGWYIYGLTSLKGYICTESSEFQGLHLMIIRIGIWTLRLLLYQPTCKLSWHFGTTHNFLGHHQNLATYDLYRVNFGYIQ